jgi:peptidoglycan hydrolase-like protein with peptidoglycan-binding domain
MHRPDFDAGHGGSDPGAVGVVHEEDVNLAITLKCLAAAKRQGWAPTATRTTDRTIQLSDRARKANANGATEFISIHADWVGAKGDGFAIITPTNHDAKKSWRMGDYLMDELKPLTAYKDTGLYTDRRGLAVLRGTDMPACIVEVLSVGDKVLKDPKFQAEVAEQIIQGLCKFYGVAYVAPGKKTPAKPKPHPKLPVLNIGDRGAAVKRLQRLLHITDDGIFGSGTWLAVKKYQRKHGLADDGVVGPKTWAKLT